MVQLKYKTDIDKKKRHISCVCVCVCVCPNYKILSFLDADAISRLINFIY